LIITVYHGSLYWDKNTPIRAKAVMYHLSQGKSLNQAMARASFLYERLTDTNDRYLLEKAMFDAQDSGHLSPFISTSEIQSVALQFATKSGRGPGYLVTITGPKEKFYDFAKVREANNIPHPSSYRWMEEKGIPYEIKCPFKVIKVDKINSINTDSECVFRDDP
jgi:hypothetical protein